MAVHASTKPSGRQQGQWAGPANGWIGRPTVYRLTRGAPYPTQRVPIKALVIYQAAGEEGGAREGRAGECANVALFLLSLSLSFKCYLLY